MENGYVTAGEKIQFVFRNARYEAFITPEGSILFNLFMLIIKAGDKIEIHTGEKQFPTPTAWTNAMSGHSTSGWGLIKIAATGEKLLTLKDKFLAQLSAKGIFYYCSFPFFFSFSFFLVSMLIYFF
jgi:hypothetical protein